MAKEQGVDPIVIGYRVSSGWKRFLSGSVA
jgi:hypothetical protein